MTPKPSSAINQYVHRMLDCGVEFAAQVMPERRTVAVEFQMLTGMVDEPVDRLGLTHVLEQTITKGTATYDAQGLADAFDRLGAACDSWSGREACGFRCLCLPEYMNEVIDLHAEFLRRPTFTDPACRIAVELGLQELDAMQDDPMELLRRHQESLAFGEKLGRHCLGQPQTLAAITQDVIRSHWQQFFSAGRLQVVAAGHVDPDALASRLDSVFAGFGSAELAGRTTTTPVFSPIIHHEPKDLQQEYIGICWPGAAVTDEFYPVERVALAVLDGGMSGRLFSEVREKQGLVYWVGAWNENPRGTGMLHIGASTTPERADQTLNTLLREIDRLAEDIGPEELERAIVGIVSRTQTTGASTTARTTGLADDLFYYGHPVPEEEKLAKIKNVTANNIAEYLARYPHDQRAVVTLGPRDLSDPQGAAGV